MSAEEVFKRIIECEGNGVSEATDSTLKNGKVLSHFKKYEEYGYHSTVALLYIGKYPGKTQMQQSAIREYIEDLTGATLSVKYIGQNIHRLKKKYSITDFPKAYGGNGLISNDGADGKCMNCYKDFVIDTHNYPANLCGCRECYPNGIGFHKSSSYQEAVDRI